MKERMKIVLVYVSALLLACCLAALCSIPFLRPVDLPIWLQTIIIGVITGFFVLISGALVGILQVAIPRLRQNVMFPFVSIAVFGPLFSTLGFILNPRHWWPMPRDMSSLQIGIFFLVLAISILIGIKTTTPHQQEIPK